MIRGFRPAFAIILCAVLAVLWPGLVWAAQADPEAAGSPPRPYTDLFEQVWTSVAEVYVGLAAGADWFAVRNYYEPLVAGAQSDEEAYRYLAEMVALLGDPSTFVMTPEEVRRAQEARDPERYSGVGMYLSEYPDGDIVVTGVFDRSPAQRGGVRKGARLVAVDGERVEGKSLQDVVAGIRGPRGTRVALTLSDPAGVERTVTLQRADIQVTTEVASERLPGGIGYLAIPSFGEGMAAQVLSHLRRLYRSDALIIDLRQHDAAFSARDFLRIAGLFTSDSLGGLYTRSGVYVMQPDRAWEGGTGAFGVPPPTNLDFWEKPIAIVVDGSVALSPFALAFVNALAESKGAVLVGRGVGPAPGVGVGQAHFELPGGGVLAVASSLLVSLKEQRIVDSIQVEAEVPLDLRYLEAWYRGDDLDIEAARSALNRRLGR